MNWQPGWGRLKVFYALHKVQKLLVFATVLITIYGMVWFVHDTCTLPIAVARVLGFVFGLPLACVVGP